MIKNKKGYTLAELLIALLLMSLALIASVIALMAAGHNKGKVLQASESSIILHTVENVIMEKVRLGKNWTCLENSFIFTDDEYGENAVIELKDGKLTIGSKYYFDDSFLLNYILSDLKFFEIHENGNTFIKITLSIDKEGSNSAEAILTESIIVSPLNLPYSS